MLKLRLKKGDEVIVLAGKDKGKKGKIIKILPKKNKAVVSDINKFKKNQKPDNNQPGGIIEKEMPIHISNLSYFDSSTNKATLLILWSIPDNRNWECSGDMFLLEPLEKTNPA